MGLTQPTGGVAPASTVCIQADRKPAYRWLAKIEQNIADQRPNKKCGS